MFVYDWHEVSESEKYVRSNNMKITHHDYILFADKTGCNTSMKKDGNIGGTKYLVKKGSTLQHMALTNDHRFTVLPFTSRNGEAVVCVVIVKCSEAQHLP